MLSRFLLIVLSCVIIVPFSLFGATYYVDAVGGNDSNSGLSTSSAWKTINKVNNSAFISGDQVLFKRGAKWREQLNFPSSGTAQNNIIIGAYGDGEKPVISGANLVTGFIFLSTNVWKKPMSRPQQLYFNEIRGKYQNSVAAVDSVNEWYYDTPTGQVIVYSNGNPSSAYTLPGIEATSRQYSLNISSDYLVFENLQVEKTFGSVIKITSFAQNIVLDNLTIYQWTIEANTNIGGIDVSGNNCEIKNCTLGKNTGQDIADQNWVGFLAMNISANNTKIHHNNLFHSSTENESLLGNRAFGIQLNLVHGVTEVYNNYVYHIGSHAILDKSNSRIGDTVKIYDNTTEYTGQAGIAAFLTRGEDGTGGIGHIYRNHVSFANRLGGDIGGGSNQSAGIHLNDGSVANTNPSQPFMKWYVYDNIVHNSQAFKKPNGNDSDGIGLDFNANAAEIYRNLVYNNWGKGIYMWNANRCKIFYNLIYNNDTGTTVTAASGTKENADFNQIYNNTYYKNWNTNAIGPNYHTEIYFGGNGEHNLIKNNIFYAHDSATVYTFRDVNTVGCITDNNIVYKNAGNFAYITEPKPGYYISYTQWRTTYPQWDANSIYADPQFVNAGSQDFHLNSSSPAINKGIDVGLTSDFYKNSLQGAPDIGAVEYIDNTPPAIVSATYISADSIRILFSEKLSVPEAQNPGNYSITNGVSVISAALNGAQTEVTLKTSIHLPGQSYTVTAVNLKDAAGNLIASPGNSASYNSSQVPVERTTILFNAMNGAFSGDARLGSMTGQKSTRSVYFQGINGGVTYNINIPKTGQWYAWARMYYMSSGGKNSFFLHSGGTAFILGDNDSKYNQWHWDGYNGSKISLGQLSAGTNTLRISGREPGTTLWVDQVVLTDDPNYIPKDADFQSTPAYTVQIISANSGTLSGDARLGTMSGQRSTRSVYFVGTNGGVTLNINIPSTGQWYAWARMYYMSSGGKNSFFFYKNGVQYILGDNDTKYNQWHWDGYLGNKLDLGTLNAGINTFRISGREPGLTLWVDQLVITNDPNYNPNTTLGKESADEEIAEIEQIPEVYKLDQNYPNPFNPATIIKYSLPQDAYVSLIIYDALGNEVHRLVEEQKSAGVYQAQFNAVNLASGIYYYTIKAGEFFEVKKMLLLK